MKEKKKFSPLWLIPAVVIIALILWCIHFPLTMFMGVDQDDFITQANIIEDKVGEDLLIKQSLSRTEDAELLSNIKLELSRVRCRFFGWYSYIEYTDGPLLWLDVTVDEENGLNGIQVITDNQGNIYLDYFKKGRGNIHLRAKDTALHDYLTELVESSEETVALNDGWNYTPDSNVVETVKSAILGEGEKDYCRSVVFHEAELDWDAREWAIKQYTNYHEGWSEEYLQENMMAVTASYTVDYDGRKTFLRSGRFERAFFLLWNSETQKWEIWENTTAAPVEEADAQEEETIKESAAAYLENLIRVRNFFEDIDLTEGTVLTADGYDDEKTVMQYIVYKTEWLREYHKGIYEDSDKQTNVQIDYLLKEIEVTDDRAVLTVEEDGPGNMWGIYTVELIEVEDTWLVASVEDGDIYTREGMELLQYREKMPELYEQARAEIFSFGGTFAAQVTNVIKTEKRILPAEDNFEYTVYTVLPGAELRVIKTDMVETTDQGLVGDWVLYDSSGDYTVINPYSSTNSIPITETTRGIGTESVCVLVFEMYTGEE